MTSVIEMASSLDDRDYNKTDSNRPLKAGSKNCQNVLACNQKYSHNLPELEETTVLHIWETSLNRISS